MPLPCHLPVQSLAQFASALPGLALISERQIHKLLEWVRSLLLPNKESSPTSLISFSLAELNAERVISRKRATAKKAAVGGERHAG